MVWKGPEKSGGSSLEGIALDQLPFRGSFTSGIAGSCQVRGKAQSQL